MSGSSEDRQQERRQSSQHFLRELVAHRGDMLACFKELLELRPYDDVDQVIEPLTRFCQLLIDYTADAHFRIYSYLEEGRERRRAVLAVAEEVYPSIMKTTDGILDFNDRYRIEEGGLPAIDGLEQDLSRLGESLADRIELEDRLIAAFGVIL